MLRIRPSLIFVAVISAVLTGAIWLLSDAGPAAAAIWFGALIGFFTVALLIPRRSRWGGVLIEVMLLTAGVVLTVGVAGHRFRPLGIALLIEPTVRLMRFALPKADPGLYAPATTEQQAPANP